MRISDIWCWITRKPKNKCSACKHGFSADGERDLLFCKKGLKPAKVGWTLITKDNERFYACHEINPRGYCGGFIDKKWVTYNFTIDNNGKIKLESVE